MNHRLIIALMALTYFFASCHRQTPIVVLNKPTPIATKPVDPDTIIAKDHLYVKGDSLYIVTLKKTYRILNDTTILHDYPSPVIYEIGKDTVKKYFSLVWNKYVLFATDDNVGFAYRGELHAFDTVAKKLVSEPHFKFKRVSLPGAAFIVNKNTDKIFCIDKPRWSEGKGWSTCATVCMLSNDKFTYRKFLYNDTSDVDDTILWEFYNKSLKKWERR